MSYIRVHVHAYRMNRILLHLQVIDWLPTLLSAAGFDMTKLPKKVDGIDMWQTLNANTSSVSLEHSTT